MAFSTSENKSNLFKTLNPADIELIEKIGNGAFSVVYRGIWNNQICAVKKLTSLHNNSSKDSFSVYKEAGILWKFRNHGNIAKCIGTCIDNSGSPWIVMQYINGKTLESLIHWLSNRKDEKVPITLSVKERIRLARQAACGLSYIHEKGYIHGDVTPHNIMVESRTNRLVICDLGTAQYFGKKLKSGSNSDTATYVSFQFGGTLTFLAPECFKEDDRGRHWISSKCDTWSLGLVLLELFSESKIFQNQKDMLNCKFLNDGKLLDIALLKVPNRQIRFILCKMLDFNSNNRPISSDIYNYLLPMSL